MTGIYITIRVFGLTGLAVFGWAVERLFKTVMFLRLSQKTSATVVRLANARTSDGQTTYLPVFEFQTAGGRIVSVKSIVASNPPAYRIGEKAQICFLPKNPNAAKINSFGELWFVTAIIAGIALLLLGIALYIYLTMMS